jgi:hypothetical protein
MDLHKLRRVELTNQLIEISDDVGPDFIEHRRRIWSWRPW